MAAPFRSPLPSLAVDGRMLVDGATGVATYARSVVDAMRSIGGDLFIVRDLADRADWFGRWRSALRDSARPLLRQDDEEPGFRALAGRHIFQAAQLSFSLRRRFMEVETDIPAGVMHWTYPVPIAIRGWRNIYTIHDVVPLDHPNLSSVDGRRFRDMLSRIVRSADRIITVSDHARSRIIDQLGCSPDLVVNCYQPVKLGDALPPRALPEGLEAGRFLLFYGTIERRKNLDRVIAAHRLSGVQLPLVLAGPDGIRGYRPEAHAMSSEGVLRLPYLSRPQLEATLRAARAVIFPSLAEGFGLPVVEAMAAGVPVLTSDSGALAEIAGDAALLVDPESTEKISAGISIIANDDELRRLMCERGYRVADRFSLAGFALRLRDVYAQPSEDAGRS
jgi:glycosyltransferase involved in cell wall biosynthesis